MLAKDNNNYKILDEIKISKVNGPNNLKLERILKESLNLSYTNSPIYSLEVTVGFENTSMAILKDSQTTRYRVKVILNYNLKEINTQKIIDSGNLYLYSSYDVSASDFMNYISEKYVSENGLIELAEELKNRLILVISTRRNEQ